MQIIRELQGLSQTQLSALCGTPQTTIPGIENGHVNLGVERAQCRAPPCAALRLSSCFPAGNLSRLRSDSFQRMHALAA